MPIIKNNTDNNIKHKPNTKCELRLNNDYLLYKIHIYYLIIQDKKFKELLNKTLPNKK